MKRWQEDYSRTFREWKKHWVSHVESNIDRGVKNPYEIDCLCDQQRGRFRKQRAFGCHQTRCLLCHSDKYPKRSITYQEWCAKLKFQESICEYEDKA